MKRSCPECGEAYIGRSDKKYCSDQCRNNSHNQRGRRVNNLVRRINRRLSINRRILKDLNPIGNNTVHREILEGKGFDFELYTKVELLDGGQELYYCYEQAYCFQSNTSIQLIDYTFTRPVVNSHSSFPVHN